MTIHVLKKRPTANETTTDLSKEKQHRATEFIYINHIFKVNWQIYTLVNTDDICLDLSQVTFLQFCPPNLFDAYCIFFSVNDTTLNPTLTLYIKEHQS